MSDCKTELIKLIESIQEHHFKTAEKLKQCGLDKGVLYWYHCNRAVQIRSRTSEIVGKKYGK